MKRKKSAKKSGKLPVMLSLFLAALGYLAWQFSPIQAIGAVASLSDPDKLATLGERGANPRLNKIVYWLHEASTRWMGPETTVKLAQTLNRTPEPRASLVRSSLARNYKIAEELGLFTTANLERLRHGNAGIVTSGPYEDTPVEIDHIVPFSLAPEVGNELANLEMLPQVLNRQKSNKVGERQLKLAHVFYDAGLISRDSMERVQAKAEAEPKRR